MFADTTAKTATGGILDDTFRSLRISGSLLLREIYAAPWGIAIPRADELGALLGVRDGARVVPFHLVEFGHCQITPEGADGMLLTAGDMAICFGGAAHRIAVGKPSLTQSVASLLSGSPNTRHPDATGGAADTSLLCGVFLLHHAQFNPLLSALPSVLHATLSRSGELHNLSGVARLLAEEIERSSSGGGYVVERLLEVLCAEAVRAHVEAAPRRETGWFRGIRDPIVGRAIAAIHACPGDDWSVRKLAREVSMSPSRFAARFSEALGDSPMAYIARWRMNVACRKLSTSGLPIGRIAVDAGYESQAAFNRAFKKLVGIPPAAWRAREGK
jgi:AraC-like DNA-binding protein